MAVTVPSWFKGRQGKAEEVAPGLVKTSAPNLKEWYVGLDRLPDGRWLAHVRETADGPDAATQELDASLAEYEAWEAAFEVYRNVVII
jgi:hypothetical protein